MPRPGKPTNLPTLARHQQTYGGGCGSDACDRARRVCLGRGRLPCDVLFVGEAPGASENVCGVPFVGPAGQLLDQIVERSVPTGLRTAYTNLVGCIPLGDTGEKAAEPKPAQIVACQGRLREFIDLARPRLVVRVGRLAQQWLGGGLKNALPLPPGVPACDVVHPAFILRANEAQQSMAVQRCVVTIQNAVLEHLSE